MDSDAISLLPLAALFLQHTLVIALKPALKLMLFLLTLRKLLIQPAKNC